MNWTKKIVSALDTQLSERLIIALTIAYIIGFFWVCSTMQPRP